MSALISEYNRCFINGYPAKAFSQKGEYAIKIKKLSGNW
jgi:hypothetical protein